MIVVRVLSILLGNFLLSIVVATWFHQPDSPSSYWITFVSERNGNADIYTMRADGLLQQQLTHDLTWDEFPSWSADREWIVFASEHYGNFDIYKIRADGSQLQQLTSAAADETFLVWSQSGQRISFNSANSGKRENDWILPDGGAFQRLSPNIIDFGSPIQSPNGDWALITAQKPSGNSDILRLRTDYSEILQLTTHPAADRNPAWSPPERPLPSMLPIVAGSIGLILIGMRLLFKSVRPST